MRFPKRVAAHVRSRYASEALASRLRERDHMLERAAQEANRIREVRAIERQFDKLETKILEPWDDSIRGEVCKLS